MGQDEAGVEHRGSTGWARGLVDLRVNHPTEVGDRGVRHKQDPIPGLICGPDNGRLAGTIPDDGARAVVAVHVLETADGFGVGRFTGHAVAPMAVEGSVAESNQIEHHDRNIGGRLR